MSGLVLDCSIAASWCFRDEATAETDAIPAGELRGLTAKANRTKKM